mgnify:CR=1 FL=1
MATTKAAGGLRDRVFKGWAPQTGVMCLALLDTGKRQSWSTTLGCGAGGSSRRSPTMTSPGSSGPGATGLPRVVPRATVGSRSRT